MRVCFGDFVKLINEGHNLPFTLTFEIHGIKSAHSLKTTTPSPGYREANSTETTQKKFDRSQLSLKSTQHCQQITTNFTGQEVTSYLNATKKGQEKSDPYVIDI